MGEVYGIGDSWITSDCYQCVCMEPFGVGCCDQWVCLKFASSKNTGLLNLNVTYFSNSVPHSGPKPVDYPDWCEIIRKPDSCTSVAVMRVNHKLPCLWGRGRLRPSAGQPWKSDNDPLF